MSRHSKADFRRWASHWKEFERRIADLLRLAGIRPSSNVKLLGRQTDVWCSVTEALCAMRIIVECKYSGTGESLRLEEVTDFCARLALARSTGIADFGWIVTNQSVPANAGEIIREAHLFDACQILSPDDLLSRMLNQSEYNAQLTSGLPDGPIGYVDLHCQVLGVFARHVGKRPTFIELARRWVTDTGARMLFLIGDYGQGKTTCAETLVRASILDPSSFDYRIPLYVRLRDVANQGYSLPAILRVALQERWGLRYSSFSVLEQLGHSGRLLFVFDGLDEISFSLRWQDVYDTFRQIAALAVEKNKLLITARSTVFPQGTPPVNALDSLARIFPKPPVNVSAAWILAELEYLDPVQVEAVAKKFGAGMLAKVQDAIRRTHDLADLSRRPILLRMILETIGEGKDADVKNAGELYQLYTNRWMERDEWRSNVAALSVEVGQHIKSSVVESLAWEMTTSRNCTEVSFDAVEQQVNQLAANLSAVSEMQRALSNEIRVCSFLSYTKTGRLSFAHFSFQEFFTAKYLASQPAERQLALLSERALTIEVLMFLGELMDWDAFLARPDVDAAMRGSRTLAGNVLRAAASKGGALSFSAIVPPRFRLALQRSQIIDLRIRDSEIESLDLSSDTSVALSAPHSNIEHLCLRSPGSIRLNLTSTEVHRLDVGSTDDLDLTLGDTSIHSGTIGNCKTLSLAVNGSAMVRGIPALYAEKVIAVAANGSTVQEDRVGDFLKAVGLHVRVQGSGEGKET